MTLDDALAVLSQKFRGRCARDAETLRRLAGGGGGPGEGMLQLAHGLAGAGATFGFPGVSDAARQVERALKRNATDEADLPGLLRALDGCASGATAGRPMSEPVSP